MLFDLSNKVAIVTGGGKGIGAAISKALSRQGAKVYVFERDAEAGTITEKEINESGGTAQFFQVDITDLNEVNKAVSQVGDEVNILVNNAGIAHIGNVENTSIDDFDRIYDVNVKGAFHCIKAVIPKMKTNGGVILNMASVLSVLGVSDRFAYSMSKGAIYTMTFSVAKDYLQYNIRCNSIAPARIHTPFVDGYLADNYPGQEKEMYETLSKTQPIGRMGKPEEVAAMAVYLCSDEAAFITGTCFPIDGGFITLNS
jgi:NAD(P)-dependent dehydrogenase (short-subunit alcohol dehydrogenase family)